MQDTPGNIPGTLGVMISDPVSGSPCTRIPVYAELTVSAPVPLVLGGTQVPEWFYPITEQAVEKAPPGVANDDAGRTRVRDVLRQVLDRAVGAEGQAWGRQTLQALADDALADAVALSPNAVLATLDDSTLAQDLWAGVDAAAAKLGRTVVPAPPSRLEMWSYPLGMLATDHVGYCSFDLLQLPEHERGLLADAIAAIRPDGPPKAGAADVALNVYPLSLNGTVVDALHEARIASGAVYARIELSTGVSTEIFGTLGLTSMQRPSLEDWRLSPSSFAASQSSLLSTDGCEDMMPANLAIREYFAYQPIAFTDVQLDDLTADSGAITVGVVQPYRIAWYSLGHSLGEILHSVALAPGESVNLAVIDWTRSEVTTRTEETAESEALLSDQNRDRQITETLSAALDEYQHGSNFTGGIAGSAGGSAGTGAYGGAAGISGALGGSTASTSGSRNLSAQTTQSLADHISQASSAQRELHSTVVVQTNESQHEGIQTRTITNYNHSHALTVLYYEVLRHFRMVVEATDRIPAAFWAAPFDPLADAEIKRTIVARRATLQQALLDPQLSANFDAAARVAQRDALAKHAPQPPGNPPAVLFRYFAIEATAHMGKGENGQYLAPLSARLQRSLGKADVGLKSASNGDTINNPWGAYRGGQDLVQSMAQVEGGETVDWSELAAVILNFGTEGDETEYALNHLKISACDTAGVWHPLIDEPISPGYINQGAEIIVPVPQAPPPPPPAADPAQDVPADDAAVDLLIDHLQYHRAYYNRALWLDQDAADRMAVLEAVPLQDGWLAGKVENRLIDVVGDKLVLPLTDPAWISLVTPREGAAPIAPKDERLLTYTTRGIFGEARLGHCNSSELIDNTRFWDWQTSPIPNAAPAIAPITAITPTPTQQGGTTPTSFPSPMINIQAAPSEPNPTGLAAALSAIVTPNIFRDLSGQAETAQLLQALAADSVSIAQASEAARNIQAKYGTGAGGGGGSAPTGAGIVGSGARALPTQPSRANRDIQDTANALQQAVSSGMVSPADAQDYMRRSLQGGVATTPDGSSNYQQARFLVPDAAASAPPTGFDLTPWLKLLNFRAPTALATKVLGAEETGEVRFTHYIERAFAGDWLVNESPLNLDYYPVTIDTMPTLPGTGKPATPQEFLEYVRLHINDFLDTSNSEFSPLEFVQTGSGPTPQGKLWTTSSPLGAVLHIDIHVLGQYIGGTLSPDDNACVYVGEAAADHWIFCTMYRAVDLGDASGGELGHPVSGNRMFGMTQDATGKPVFFTRGADRPTSRLDAAKWERVFAGADALWTSLQQKTVAQIAAMGGKASITPKEQHGFNWSSIPKGVFDPAAAGSPPQYWPPGVYLVSIGNDPPDTVTV